MNYRGSFDSVSALQVGSDNVNSLRNWGPIFKAYFQSSEMPRGLEAAKIPDMNHKKAMTFIEDKLNQSPEHCPESELLLIGDDGAGGM